ncbi:hypothetical protein DPMN_155566 [Dreissena polymorpha]|uniref:Uncharacterized protein n=1 Tax=Dreissena polymorpha TaxID=45954 RepID=A0A9D4JA28_DREPO|nr:hypothetical protein DPMN_155566 [Dreissena polymorpha]
MKLIWLWTCPLRAYQVSVVHGLCRCSVLARLPGQFLLGVWSNLFVSIALGDEDVFSEALAM